MSNPSGYTHHLKHQKNPSILASRGVIGCIGAGVGSLFLLAITFVLGANPVGLIILGQYLLLKQSVYFIYSLLNDGLDSGIISYGLVEMISIIAFSSIWGLIGALLALKERKQRIAGWLLILLYLIAGYISFRIFGSSIIPT
jgi:hypothetical protein